MRNIKTLVTWRKLKVEPDRDELYDFTQEELDRANQKMNETIQEKLLSTRKTLKKIKKYMSSSLYEINRISKPNQ